MKHPPSFLLILKHFGLLCQGKNPLHINYYQWVPVVIALQAFFFQLPYVFWYNMSIAGGMNLPHIMRGEVASGMRQGSGGNHNVWQALFLILLGLA